jgi:hypothetical protein
MYVVQFRYLDRSIVLVVVGGVAGTKGCIIIKRGECFYTACTNHCACVLRVEFIVFESYIKLSHEFNVSNKSRWLFAFFAIPSYSKKSTIQHLDNLLQYFF